MSIIRIKGDFYSEQETGKETWLSLSTLTCHLLQNSFRITNLYLGLASQPNVFSSMTKRFFDAVTGTVISHLYKFVTVYPLIPHYN